MVVQHNLTAMNANRYLGINNTKLGKSLEKLSSGYAINRAGDNAAGLAVSEKMRSQIAGMTQGVKNSQDGISMVQTFEGALTETDSILQRMKTLATQSANGTYDNDVDRAAIQLEFDQLNDELDQIADTDFNGVVALNGGKMADGLEEVDGLFDYANKGDQVTAEAKDVANAAVKAAQEAYDAAKTAYDGANFDLSEDGTAAEWNTVDNSKYDKTAADGLWKDLGIVDANDNADVSKVTSIDITFKFDGTNWTADSAVDNTGKKYSADALTDAGITATNSAAGGGTDATGNGGFDVKSTTNTNAFANAIFDATNAKAGDTVTLTFTNGKPAAQAPNNAGFKENSVEINSTGTTAYTTAPAIALEDIDDDAMTEAIQKAYEALEGLTFEGTIDDTNATTFKINGSTTFGAVGDLFITDNNDGTVTFSALDAAGTGKGTDIATLTVATGVADNAATVKGTIALEYSSFSDQSSITATVGEDPNLESSSAGGLKQALDKATADLAAAQEDLAGITDYETAKEYLAKTGVSISDSYDQSTTKLTYTDNITLQVGGRSKDAVNFTFKYSSEGLGGLDADLNCTAEGLGTSKLSLATQKSANEAIDKIDNALNKVSMVRATFGSVQNRLEHKIDNMNVTIENLTSAESRIRDTDMATEMMNFTKQNILTQASQSMLAQANQLPQSVLSLLQ